MVSSITQTTAPPTPPAHRGHSDSDLTPEVSSNEENSQESISTNKFDSENCFSDVSDDSGSKSASADDEDHLKAKNKHLEQKLAELAIKLEENKLVIQSLANKNDNLREESELNRANMTEWIDQLKEKIIHLEVSTSYIYNIFNSNNIRRKIARKTNKSRRTSPRTII
jgi:hypothetical protein